jgi:hypothetical protein
MANIRRANFNGSIPGVAPHLLPENAAQMAKNCRLVNGNIAPLRDNAFEATPAKAGTKLSIFRMGNYWLHWISEVDAVQALQAGDTENTTYFTENGELRVTNAAMATTGGDQYPMDWRRVGVPAPDTAISATLSGTPDNPYDYSNTESRTYVYSFITDKGEEGPWSPASNIVDWMPGLVVDLTGFPASAHSEYDGIVGMRVYRRVPNEGFCYVTDVAFGISLQDSLPTSSLGEEIPSKNWYPPPDFMHSIVNHPSGFMVGASRNEIVPSEAGLPHAYDPFNRQTLPADIMALGVVGQGIIIFTGEGLWFASGTTPEALSIEKVELDQSCSSRNSVFEIANGGGVGFASPDGIFAYGLGSAPNLTQGLFTPDQWRALDPSSMLCAYHDGKIFVFYDNGTPGGFIVYPGQTPSMVELDFHATAAYVDKETDTLYLMVGADIVAFDAGTTYKTATWKGRIEYTGRHIAPGTMRVRATAYPVTVNLYADGALKHTKEVSSNRPIRIPTGYLSEEFEIECIVSEGEVSEIVVAETMRDFRSV